MDYLTIYEPQIYKLYAHVNRINNKKYFGITKNSVTERWDKGNGYRKGSHIRRAFNKYGWDNFAHFIVIDKLTYTEAIAYEESFIKIFNTTNRLKGYNKDKGGKNFALRPHVRESMEERGLIKPVVHIETRKVYLDSTEASFYTGYEASSIRRTCNSKKFLLFNSHWAFKEDFDKLTNVEIEKILNMKPKNYYDDNRKVICLETLEIFDNAEAAQKVYKSTTESCIRACCKHTDSNRITAAKRHWLYLTEYETLSTKEIEAILNKKAGQRTSKAVIKLETLETYSSIEEASNRTGLSSKTIRYSCTGQRITNPKNGHWMFKVDYDKSTPKDIEERLKISRKGKTLNMRKVRCVETGEIFRSLVEANEAVGGCCNSSMISKCCKVPTKTYRGYHWEYVE